MDIKTLKRVYFLGIGGIGMSAIARYFNAMGVAVSGYDRTPSSLTAELENEGISIHFDENISAIPQNIELVIHTPAVPTDHAEYIYFIKNKVPIVKRAEVLGLITQNMQTIAVAGTHGKTSISCMIAYILSMALYKINAFIGGISVNFGSNIIISSEAKTTVVEADEFDRSFLQLSPDIAIISAMDADHLDIYGSLDSFKESFIHFINKINNKGLLICNQKLDLPEFRNIRKLTYGLDSGDYHAKNIVIKNDHFVFDLVGSGIDISEIRMGVAGRHNIENAIAACVVCCQYKVQPEIIKEALWSFKGVKRRFEIHIQEKNQIYVDDYAHHPEEIRACINAAREMWPGKMITGVFQPHLFSRTRDFADDFASALNELDALILLPVYPARELPIEGVDSAMLLSKINISDKRLANKETLLSTIAEHINDVVITMGAGDIDQWVEPIHKMLMFKLNLKNK